MTIEEQLRVDQTTAMKARDKDTLNAIRSVQAEVATESAKQAGVPVVQIEGDHSPFYSNVSELARVLEGGKA